MRKKRQQDCRKLRKKEEMAWAPPTNKPKLTDWEETRERKESEWRLEPEGEAEVPEIIVVWKVLSWTWRTKAVGAGRSKALQERKRNAQRR